MNYALLASTLIFDLPGAGFTGESVAVRRSETHLRPARTRRTKALTPSYISDAKRVLRVAYSASTLSSHRPHAMLSFCPGGLPFIKNLSQEAS